MSIKDKLYDTVVRKNENIRYEYERYVQENLNEHYTNRFKQWKVLWALTKHYRIKKKKTPLIYWDTVKVKKEANTCFNKKTVDNTSKQKVISSEKRTWLNSAESEIMGRPFPHHLAARLMPYDIVSFDIFDTLLFRPFDEPKSLFMLLEDKFGIIDFCRIRIEAEAEVRKMHSILNGNRECTIFDIYEIINNRTGLDISFGVETEIQMEMEMCYANPYMLHVFNILKGQGKRIFISSDMYLPRKTIEDLLYKNGFYGYEKLFLSNEYLGSKNDGVLYDAVLKHVGENERIIHIGDNLQVDVKNARKKGIEAYHYAPCIAESNKARTKRMSPLIGSAYRGMVANRLYCGNKKYSCAFEHGYIYGGILAIGFSAWLKRECDTNNIEKLLFVSRDGKIYQTVFNKLYSEYPSEYVYWSRIAHLISCAEFNRDLFIQRFFRDKLNKSLSLEEILNDLFLSLLIPSLEKYGLKQEHILSANTIKLVERFIVGEWDKILSVYCETKEFEIQYFKKVIGESKSIGIVDVGWTGYGELDLKKLINEYISKDIDVHVFVIGTVHSYPLSTQGEILKQNIKPYAFSCNYNRDLYQNHIGTNNRTNNVFVELLSQDTIPSYIGYKNNQICFDYPEVENYQMIREMHDGVIAFVDEYTNKFGKYELMMMISGADAYAPLSHSYLNVKYYFNKLGDFCFTRSVLGSKKMETLKQIGKNNKLI